MAYGFEFALDANHFHENPTSVLGFWNNHDKSGTMGTRFFERGLLIDKVGVRPVYTVL